jgi:glycosyltransferase involved in cell wall biosynthesis
VFNAEDYLERSISSVLAQTHVPLELILVESGSTDSSAAICRKWAQKDKRISCLQHCIPGPGPARNAGVQAASAEYVTFLDADDWLEPAFIEKILGSMIDSGSDVGQCDICYFDSATMAKQIVRLRFGGPIVSCRNDSSVLNKSRLFAWGKIFRRGLFESCNFSFPALAYEDTLTPILIAAANQVSYVAEPLINYYRNRPGSLSNNSQKIGDMGAALALLREKFIELGMYEAFEPEIKKIALGQLRFACRKWGNASDECVMAALRELEKKILEMLPDLDGLTQKKYFAFESQVLANALDKAVPYAHQAQGDILGADCIVLFERDVHRVGSGAKIISLPSPTQPLADSETQEFNLAELIMEKM